MTELPPKPKVSYGETGDIAQAKALSHLTDTTSDALLMLSAIESSDVERYALLLSIGRDEDANCSFVNNYVFAELALSNSVVRKIGGIRSEQIKEIIKHPDINMQGEQRQGLLGRVRERFSR